MRQLINMLMLMLLMMMMMVVVMVVMVMVMVLTVVSLVIVASCVLSVSSTVQLQFVLEAAGRHLKSSLTAVIRVDVSRATSCLSCSVRD